MIWVLNSPSVSLVLMSLAKSRISKYMIPFYRRWFRANDVDSKHGAEAFESLHEYFIREWKEEARPVDATPHAVISPVDGLVKQMGDINHDKIHVKGISYSLQTLLNDEDMEQRYLNGKFIVLYLSPGDYHRIYSPVTAKILSQYGIGGRSFPVNKWGLKYGRSPITSNFRIVTELLDDTGGNIGFVKVGAMWVNTIEITHEGMHLNKGEEVGYFSFGSAVVLLFPLGDTVFPDTIVENRWIRSGEKLALKR
ncbi:archaetidylserine decarboxylase [Halobacillus salinus]|uniref:phosphatidylserine decarboxylase n=1 Tax=Halobacillus salinus TaxID=192814 RepID=A0A4Z0H485_9BACI|nr:archaetidylserine decarboxylase [Halobacillus salinus]TGB04734.1 phosphatidylserine decarboxylase [Halobacillus salinus]